MLLLLIIVVVMICTYIVPAGVYDRFVDEATGRTLVDPSTYHRVDQSPVNPFQMFSMMAVALDAVSNIIFLIAFGFFWVYSVMQSGALTSAINKLLNSKARNSKLFIPICMFIFAIAGSTYGELETVYGLVPIFVALAIALGYDAIVGLCMCFVGVATGFASATTNAFTIGVAHLLRGYHVRHRQDSSGEAVQVLHPRVRHLLRRSGDSDRRRRDDQLSVILPKNEQRFTAGLPVTRACCKTRFLARIARVNRLKSYGELPDLQFPITFTLN